MNQKSLQVISICPSDVFPVGKTAKIRIQPEFRDILGNYVEEYPTKIIQKNEKNATRCESYQVGTEF